MKLLILAAAALLAGCVTGNNMVQLHEGMTQAEVTDLLGGPDGFQRYGDSVALKYSNRLMSGWSWDRTDYYAILNNGKLAEWGNGIIRQNDPTNSLVLITTSL